MSGKSLLFCLLSFQLMKDTETKVMSLIGVDTNNESVNISSFLNCEFISKNNNISSSENCEVIGNQSKALFLIKVFY